MNNANSTMKLELRSCLFKPVPSVTVCGSHMKSRLSSNGSYKVTECSRLCRSTHLVSHSGFSFVLDFSDFRDFSYIRVEQTFQGHAAVLAKI